MKTTLHDQLVNLVSQERRITSRILDLLQEVQNSRAYLEWGHANLFIYLVKGLGYSEARAFAGT